MVKLWYDSYMLSWRESIIYNPIAMHFRSPSSPKFDIQAHKLYLRVEDKVITLLEKELYLRMLLTKYDLFLHENLKPIEDMFYTRIVDDFGVKNALNNPYQFLLFALDELAKYSNPFTRAKFQLMRKTK